MPIPGSDVALVAALQAEQIGARDALFERYSDDVERILYRILGHDPEIADLLQDVFVVALASLHTLRDAGALRSWLVSVAVRKARKAIQRRRRWRFIQLMAPGDLPERPVEGVVPEVSEALRCTYAVLAQLPADERVAFALRHIDGMELTAVAAACQVSLATIKRRLRRARARFVDLARAHPALAEWLARGGMAP